MSLAKNRGSRACRGGVTPPVPTRSGQAQLKWHLGLLLYSEPGRGEPERRRRFPFPSSPRAATCRVESWTRPTLITCTRFGSLPFECWCIWARSSFTAKAPSAQRIAKVFEVLASPWRPSRLRGEFCSNQHLTGGPSAFYMSGKAWDRRTEYSLDSDTRYTSRTPIQC